MTSPSRRRGARIATRLVACTLALAALGSSVNAQSGGAGYPSRFVRVIVPFGPAGSADVVARIFAKAVGEHAGSPQWSQQVLVENKPGADADLGAEAVAKSQPDGYTILLTTQVLAVNESLRPTNRPYKISDLRPIMLAASTQAVLASPSTLPVTSVAELVALAKAKPGTLDFGSTGVGTTGHLTMELFRLATGIDIVHIPFRNIGQQMTDLIAGRIAMATPTVPGAMPHLKAGRIRPLAVTGVIRSPALPDVPTMQQAGVADYEATTWFALLAPSGVSTQIIDTLNAAFGAALKRPDVVARLADLGIEPEGGTPEKLGVHLDAEIARWSKVIRDAGVRAQ